jgi:hypothetical protein
VDARLHHLQGKTEGVTPTELLQLLREFYVERLALLLQHEAAARLVSDYDVNNAYQYIISREETHVSWLERALMEEGREIPPAPATPPIGGSRKHDDVVRELAGNDARANEQFVSTWRDRIEEVTNARHRGMLRVILGEMLEHQRLFQQAAEGRRDLTGRALDIHERRGKVMSTRWVE